MNIVSTGELHDILFDEHPDGIFILDTKGFFVQGNPAAEKIIGYSKEELLGKHFTKVNLLPFSQIPKATRFLAEILLGARIESEEFNLIRKDNSRIDIELKSRKIRIEGKTYILGSARDISFRKEALRKIQQSEEKFRAIVENSKPIIFVIDNEGKFTLSEGKSLSSLGLQPKQVVGLSSFDVYKDYPEITKAITKALKGELVCHSIPIGETHFDVFYSPYKDSKGKVIGMIGMAIDVSDVKKSEIELIQAKEKAEESDKLKSKFVANISHEIRTPLNVILGFSELLCDVDLNKEDADNYFKIIQDGGGQLLSIINNLLDISIIESGKLQINEEDVSLKDLVVSLQNQYNTFNISSDKGIQIQAKTEYTLRVDPYRLRQVLNNLLSNAIKYTDTGTISLGYEVLKNTILFHVSDKGPGMIPEVLEKIFNRFYRVESNEKVTHGSGLGLAISKAIVEQMGGKIWVESQPGKGTTFFFTIPK